MKELMKKVVSSRLLSFTLLMVASKAAMATCGFMDSRFSANDTVSLNFGTVILQRDTPIGSVVATLNDSTLGGRNNFIECNATGFSSQWAAGAGFTPVSYGGQTLYQSGIAGLAYRIVTAGAGSTAGRYGTGPLPRQLSGVACTSGSNWWRLCGGTWGSYRLQLVKIAAITGSGTLTTGSITQALIPGQTTIMNYTIGSGTVQTVACSVTNSNITVNMGTTKNTDFSGPGSTSGDADFAINLNCDASTNVNLTLAAGSSGADNATEGVLKLDNSGAAQSASGVGVQVLFNNAPVALGKMLKIATTTADGMYAVPLKARYYQTLDRVTPGKADANATFTMTYQ
jgi:type 1 fimbria pilin